MGQRQSDSPQKAALQEMIGAYMKENIVRIKDGADVKSVMRDMMSAILKETLNCVRY